MNLSAIVITKNEERNIARCLNSLAFADEAIVVDANSTDQTAAIAQQHGARVFTRVWPGYGQQKNFGAQQAQGKWLLFIDADEEVPPELAQEILRTIASPTVDFYWLKIVTVFMHRPLQHMYGHNPRLFKKSVGEWTDAHVHEQVQRQADHNEAAEYQVVQLDDTFSQILKHPLLHHSHPTLASYLIKMHRYTTLDAKQMAQTNKHRSGRAAQPSWWLPPYLAMRQFAKLMLYRRGILDGWQGWMWCFLSGYYEWEMSNKYLALMQKDQSPLTNDHTGPHSP